MATSAFLTYDTGYKEILDGTSPWAGTTMAAILLADTYTPNRATHTTYGDVSANEISDVDYSQQAVPTKSAALSGTQVQFTHAKISFGASVTITAKYLVYVVGTAGALVAGDRIVGYVDLNSGGGSVSSSSGEFSFTPDGTDGLWEVNRTA